MTLTFKLPLDTVKASAKHSSCASITFDGVTYEVSIETFTYQRASDALAHNKNNRPLNQHNLKVIEASLNRGEWMLNGETIVFGVDGNLIQGQHRLHAVIKTGVPITSFVVRGIANEAFKTLDCGRRRGAPDALAIAGHSYGPALAAAIRAIIAIEVGSTELNVVTPSTIVEYVKKHPLVTSWLSEYSSSSRRTMPAAFVGVVTLMHERFGFEVANKFYQQVMIGANLPMSSPAFMLRDKFVSRVRGQSFTAQASLAYMIKAANAHILGKSMSILRINKDEAMPRLLLA